MSAWLLRHPLTKTNKDCCQDTGDSRGLYPSMPTKSASLLLRAFSAHRGIGHVPTGCYVLLHVLVCCCQWLTSLSHTACYTALLLENIVT